MQKLFMRTTAAIGQLLVTTSTLAILREVAPMPTLAILREVAPIMERLRHTYIMEVPACIYIKKMPFILSHQL